MKCRTITVESALDGTKRDALLVICPACDGETFSVFQIDDVHQHLQCVDCGTSFCSGGCLIEGTPKGAS